MGGLHGTHRYSGVQESRVDQTDSSTSQTLALRLPPYSQTWVPNACLGSAELLLWPCQAPGVVSTFILFLAHGGRCPQALGPEQGPWASSSLGLPSCRDRKIVRKPGGSATVLYGGLWLWQGGESI